MSQTDHRTNNWKKSYNHGLKKRVRLHFLLLWLTFAKENESLWLYSFFLADLWFNSSQVLRSYWTEADPGFSSWGGAPVRNDLTGGWQTNFESELWRRRLMTRLSWWTAEKTYHLHGTPHKFLNIILCFTSTPINHSFFFLFYLQNIDLSGICRSFQGGGVHTPCIPPLDLLLFHLQLFAYYSVRYLSEPVCLKGIKFFLSILQNFKLPICGFQQINRV